MNFLKIIYSPTFLLFILLLSGHSAKSQKVDTDSLLTVIVKDMKNNPPNYKLNLERSLLGKKLAPDYLDYYLLLGRNHELLQQKDSARYYYNYVIDKNPKYEDAFAYLINLDLEEKKYDEGLMIANKAIDLYPENKNFQLKRIAYYSSQKYTKNEEKSLQSIKEKFPNDPEIQQLLVNLYSEINSDILGVYYNFTSISRDAVGPWHLASANYIRQRKWGSLVGRISYANRFSQSQSIANGIQYEIESYINTGKKSYSYFDVAYSSDLAFPKLRLAYSFFYNFKNGWEADLGARYIKGKDSESASFNVGVGKYIGSAWLNFRTYIQKDNPAFLINSRYYFKSKYDYVSLFGGYGTSPDNRTTLGEYEQRSTLESYRIGIGYSVTFSKHYIGGFLASFNKQEYVPGLNQNELELGFSLQYKL
ncbi:YaiO family outer membrane beta-barrel protein [Flavobacterium sp. Fl-77]|uniref:YaiO family outer membrane beta-barrel protein n=1 Tax=Flavobacterium flavipigmentatum TaxID=2893884 RepID=A0AAJ2SE23_9FLAO|nr:MULTISPECIES: YaiO family outer membrane beta-barrel protein [unclassified Flavobacterium]MDX6181726.1 YaiO family outer membrane beta-barrel protein [Flavobacterium sp. Fl-33]MDX6185240.1 YaiO family outer membrane beta-barrel protein [Flavobacterium sp. Fl-77]UFH37346.1 YaiO family outer membrane beta-barrel protein [Flavobacterium sp. F-70]